MTKSKNKHSGRVFLFILIFLAVLSPAAAERVSLRLSFTAPFITPGDLDTWINSYNALWTDWKNKLGANLQGEYESLRFGPAFEGELRIRLVSGLALSLSGSYLSGRKEGAVDFTSADGNQKEAQSLSYKVSAIPLKIGLSFTFPVFSNFHVFVNGGRHIIFVSFKTREDYDAIFKIQNREFVYWYKKENNFNSEALGYYLSAGVEYNLLRFLSVTLEGENVWSKVDGFKGPYTYQTIIAPDESGKASLYFYESNQWGVDKFYAVLAGHKDRPELSVRNVRQGVLDFSGLSIKAGLRLKF